MRKVVRLGYFLKSVLIIEVVVVFGVVGVVVVFSVMKIEDFLEVIVVVFRIEGEVVVEEVIIEEVLIVVEVVVIVRIVGVIIIGIIIILIIEVVIIGFFSNSCYYSSFCYYSYYFSSYCYYLVIVLFGIFQGLVFIIRIVIFLV